MSILTTDPCTATNRFQIVQCLVWLNFPT